MTHEILPHELRSHRWFGVDDLRSFGHRSRMRQMGYSAEDFAGKPVIGIINTWSDISPCHAHFKQRVEDVKRGVLQSGGFPIELPAMSLSEIFQKPTTMLYRNFLAMETEELLRSHPVDGCVLMGGCDKTTPALLMGAASMNLPAVFLPAGPMLPGRWAGKSLGSGTDTWKYWQELRVGTITRADWDAIEAGIARTPGHCMTMGTASTMTSAAEAMGMTLPGAASIPAPMAAHIQMSAATGRRIVDMVWEDLRPRTILTREALRNAAAVILALAGSTNSVIHLIALSKRTNADITLDDFDQLARSVPVLANIRPSGDYLMSDFYDAGGLPALMLNLGDRLDLDSVTVNGRTLRANLEGATVYDEAVIRTPETAVRSSGGLAVLKGTLAPNGCVIKVSAASPALLQHRGPAVVFDNYEDLSARIDDPELEVTAASVLILRGCGPVGGPGMPEWGMLPIPKKLLAEGVEDMVRISDARMSGTSYGTCILHVAPESAVGGPLALVRTGDVVEIDVEQRRIDLVVDEAELAARRVQWVPPEPVYERGFGALSAQHISQADQGCDFDFLEGAGNPEPAIH